MARKWLNFINLLLASVILALTGAALFFSLNRPAEIPYANLTKNKSDLPKSHFSLSRESYDAIASVALSLKSSPPSMQLPDLRQHLTYYGTNGRPDASLDKTMLYFSLANNKIPASVVPKEPLYLYYDKKQTPARYAFSPDNAPTPLWIVAENKGGEVFVKVSMKNELDELVQEPSTNVEFNLPEKEFARFTSGNWEIGKWKVDGSILARQKARWYGQDLFLEKHGGDDYQNALNKQRIDFGDGEDTYSCFISQGDSLIWDENRWKEVIPGENSRGKPLLHVKKIDDRLMNFELWDNEGKSKIVLNIIKSMEPWTPQIIMKDFKFVGARTKTQCVFEINQDRMTLRPHDWLLLTDEGWVKLNTVEEIDDYVNRKKTGALFVFEGLVKKEDKQLLLGTMYNASRTEMQSVELAVQQSNVTIIPTTPELEHGKPQEEQAKVILPKVIFPAKEIIK